MQISKCNVISGYEPNSTTHSYMSWSTTTKTVHSRDEYESEQVDEYMINQDQLIHYHPSRVAVYVFCVGVDDVSSENHTVRVCDHPQDPYGTKWTSNLELIQKMPSKIIY